MTYASPNCSRDKRLAENRQRILATISDTPRTAAEIGAIVGISSKAVCQVLTRIERAGGVTVVGERRYGTGTVSLWATAPILSPTLSAQLDSQRLWRAVGAV